MTDSALRSLERAHKADPLDVELRDRLEAARLRAGLGWFGERLPARLVPRLSERQVYDYLVPGAADGKAEPIAMVYVPGSEIECPNEREDGFHARRPRPSCDLCEGTGRLPLGPLYIGKFPLMNCEWRPNGWSAVRSWDERDYAPIVNVSHADALAFCSWAGLRLPSTEEWRWAALGGPRCPCKARDCPNPKGARYPWGKEPPTPERCVFSNGYGDRTIRTEFVADVPGAVSGSLVAVDQDGGLRLVGRDDVAVGAVTGFRDGHAVVTIFQHEAVGPKPVLVEACPRGFHVSTCGHPPEKRRLVPARPSGTSWCGAHDMAGNVWEWTSTPGTSGYVLLGGSFRDRIDQVAGILSVAQNADVGQDDTGFRVALSSPR